MRSAKLLALTLVLLFTLASHAFAITRSESVARGKEWIDDGIVYSQTRYHEGYRRDCSGFVSMAWEANESYTTSTLDEISHGIKWDELKPGDAVNRPGKHVVLFVEWIDREDGVFLCYEESTWGRPALSRERVSGGHGYHPIRYDYMEEDPLPPPTEEEMKELFLQAFREMEHKQEIEARAELDRIIDSILNPDLSVLSVP